jgi:hypothetical protein
MTEDPQLLLSALLDREPVDADVLKQLLEAPAGRALLVDFVRLRGLVREEESAAASTPGPVRVWKYAPQRILLRGAAAVIVFLTGLAGGAWWSERRETQPPIPHRVVQFQPGAEWQPAARK